MMDTSQIPKICSDEVPRDERENEKVRIEFTAELRAALQKVLLELEVFLRDSR